MGTKLVVSVSGLLLTNTSTVVRERSLDGVVLVGTSSEFNNLDSTQLTTIKSRIDSNIPSNATFQIALANESSATLSDDFYNFLSSNNYTFFNDPTLQSLSSSEVLTGSNITTISSSDITSFNTTTVASNSIFGLSTSLGSNFGTKPSITVSTPSYLDDLGGSISVTISAAQFATILNSSTANAVDVTDTSNLTIQADTNTYTALSGPFAPITFSQVETPYNGSNRLGNVSGVSSSQSTQGDNEANVYWASTGADIETAFDGISSCSLR